MRERMAPLNSIQQVREFFATDTTVALHRTNGMPYDARATAQLKALVGDLVRIMFLVSVQCKGWSEVGVREIDSVLLSAPPPLAF